MQLTQEEKQERKAARTRARFKKLVRGADFAFDARGYACFTFSDGQIFKCCGPLPESIYGTAKCGYERTVEQD